MMLGLVSVAVAVSRVAPAASEIAAPANASAKKEGFKGTVDVAGPNRVHIKLSESIPNVYGWRVSGRSLTLTKVKDTFANRAAVFWGVWHRK